MLTLDKKKFPSSVKLHLHLNIIFVINVCIHKKNDQLQITWQHLQFYIIFSFLIIYV